MTIFDSAQFSSVKPFSYFFFWAGLLAVLYPPYIQIAKWKKIADWSKYWLNKKNDKNPKQGTLNKNNSQTAPVSPINQNKPITLQATATKEGKNNEDKIKAEQEAFAEAEKNRTESKQYLNKSPILESIRFNSKISQEDKNISKPVQKDEAEKQNKPNSNLEGCTNYYSFHYYHEKEDLNLETRQQMYNNVWRHFRSDYRRMNPITKHDGVVEFWRMIKSSLSLRQSTKKKRSMINKKKLCLNVPATFVQRHNLS